MFYLPRFLNPPAWAHDETAQAGRSISPSWSPWTPVGPAGVADPTDSTGSGSSHGASTAEVVRRSRLRAPLRRRRRSARSKKASASAPSLATRASRRRETRAARRRAVRWPRPAPEPTSRARSGRTRRPGARWCCRSIRSPTPRASGDRFVLLSGGRVRGEGTFDELSGRWRAAHGAPAADLGRGLPCAHVAGRRHEGRTRHAEKLSANLRNR